MPRSPDYNDKTDEAGRPTPPGPTGTITPVLEPNEARGGVTHHNVRFVLAISLGVAALVLAIVLFAYFG